MTDDSIPRKLHEVELEILKHRNPIEYEAEMKFIHTKLVRNYVEALLDESLSDRADSHGRVSEWYLP
jgi:hypothetical protein